MTFISNIENPNKIIKNYIKNGDNYTVYYMDGSCASYFCSAEDHEEKIKQNMLEQAFERQENMNLPMTQFKKDVSLLISLLSALSTVALANNGHPELSSFTILALLISTWKRREYNSKLKELKKYKLFFELLPDLDKVNDSEFLKCVEFDKFYQKPLQINTVDDYSFGEVKTIHKKIKQIKK